MQRGRLLLRLADGVSGYTVAAEWGCCVQTVYQVRRRYVEQGLATVLGEATPLTKHSSGFVKMVS